MDKIKCQDKEVFMMKHVAGLHQTPWQYIYADIINITHL
jgi:hypothetical protein